MSDLLAQIDFDTQSQSRQKTSGLSYHSVGETHRGYIRQYNEDAYIEIAEQKFWAVADGMGGHNRGDYASKAVVKALQDYRRKESLESTIQCLENRITQANDACQKAFHTKRVGSTVAALFEYDNYCFFLWAGDSRIYRLRDGNLQQMTHDHSVAQEKLDRGELTQDEADAHPSAHILTRAVGVHRTVKPQLQHSAAMSTDRYLLCSDGLYSDLSNQKIHTLLSLKPPKESLSALMDAALKSGGRDNITAIIVDLT